MNQPTSVKTLEDFGRVQLSKSFFMRDFLYSEISQIERIANIPDDPDLAIEAGHNICEKVLEPIQDALGRIAIRSAFRSCDVNARGAENRNQYSCAVNESNYAGHIWDRRDADGYMGATACIVVPSFLPYFERTGDWTALAWWVHDNVPDHAGMHFFPKLAAFNVSWYENPDCEKRISTYIKNPHTGHKKALTRAGMDNFTGSHEITYNEYLASLKK